MEAMFDQATSFDQPLDSWDISSVMDMSRVFYGATSFDQHFNGWNVTSVTTMRSMFYSSASFNQNLCQWFNLPFRELPFVLSMFGGTNCDETADPL